MSSCGSLGDLFHSRIKMCDAPNMSTDDGDDDYREDKNTSASIHNAKDLIT